MGQMSLRGAPVEADATLPDGSTVHVRIGVPDDGYIKKRDFSAFGWYRIILAVVFYLVFLR